MSSKVEFVEGPEAGPMSLIEIHDTIGEVIDYHNNGIAGMFDMGSKILDHAVSTRNNCIMSLLQIDMQRARLVAAIGPVFVVPGLC